MTAGMQARAALFAEVKDGNADEEWEDGAASGPPTPDHGPRVAVADGATEAYDAGRWAELLVASFVLDGPPTLGAPHLGPWFGAVQDRWAAGAPREFATVFEERKFAQGSFATFLGCELTGLDTTAPAWEAVALGDAVLFQVRDGRRITHFPALRAEDFGTTPDGAHTRPAALDHMLGHLESGHGDLAAGDHLFLATDAVAQWILRRQCPALWAALAALDHPAPFSRIVADQRAAGAMRNDDVTLVRVDISADDPEFLVVTLS